LQIAGLKFGRAAAGRPPAWLGIGLAATVAMGDPLRVRAPAGPEEQDLARLVRRFYDGIGSEDEAERKAAFAEVIPSRQDLDALLGPRDAALLWREAEIRLPDFLEHPPRMASRSRAEGHIDNILDGVEIVDLRENARRYAGFLRLIPEDVPACKVVTHRAGGEPDAMSGPYVRVGGRWVLLQEGERIPAALRRLRVKPVGRRSEADASPAGTMPGEAAATNTTPQER
jgi:hypothetical protein